MARVLVVSTVEVDRSLLVEHVDSADEVVVVVPAVEQSRLEWLANDEGDARARAREVGETIAGEAPGTASEIEVTREVPSQAVVDAIAEHRPDRIVVALREGEDASWLEEGELGEVPGLLGGVPVTRVSV